MKKGIIYLALAACAVMPVRAQAFFDGGAGWAQIAYLAKLAEESVKQFLLEINKGLNSGNLRVTKTPSLNRHWPPRRI